MAIFVIGDLHLGFSCDKPMHIFGEHWRDHHEKIKQDWLAKVSTDDLVILAGDTSWASSFKEAAPDLTWIDKLPGQKLLLKGNHDYWWQTLKKMRGVYPTLEYLQNDSYVYGDYVIVGARGWEIGDNKIYKRELIRLRLSMESAPSDKEKICILHYPPFDENGERTEVIDIIEEFKVKRVYFGHIHSNHEAVKQGRYNDCEYALIACDYTDFKLRQVEPKV